MLVMSAVFLGFTHGLFQNRVGKAALDQNGHGLCGCSRGHSALQNSFGHFLAPYSAAAAAFSLRMDITRATSRRTTRTRAVFSSWPVACWKRRLKASFFSAVSCSRN